MLRAAHDAVLIGAETARRDNPSLLARTSPPPAKQPARVVLTTRLDLPPDLRMFGELDEAPVLVFAGERTSPARHAILSAMGAQIEGVALKDGALDIIAALERLAALRQAKIGLWDVIRSAERRTSNDAHIRRADPHDLAALVSTLPALRMIAFNGGKAAAIGRRQLPTLANIALVDLPSSSAAHTIGYEAKLDRWLALGSAL